MTGIYCIENNVNHKKYIGQAKDIEKRWERHREMLRSGNHDNKHLQRAWDKYGGKMFSFYVVELCDEQSLSEREIFYIAEFDTYENGYNQTLGGEGTRGFYHTEEWKMWLRMLNTGKVLSEETRKKLSEAKKGKHVEVTPAMREAYKRLSEKLKGRVITEEHRRKISEAKKGCTPWNKGMKMPDDYKHPLLGKHHSEETKKKISDAHRGMKQTLEQRRKKSKKVICIETGIIYPAISEAAEEYGVDISTISCAVRGKLKTAKGLHWKYYYEE